jgi:hypothetical protein
MRLRYSADTAEYALLRSSETDLPTLSAIRCRNSAQRVISSGSLSSRSSALSMLAFVPMCCPESAFGGSGSPRRHAVLVTVAASFSWGAGCETSLTRQCSVKLCGGMTFL